ncbi:MAG: M28 family peptidase [Nitrospirae bacterium]|nr:M28 family peptidase [Nitrospirota bacterium]
MIRRLIVIFVGLVLPITTAWVLVTQPGIQCGGNKPAPVTVDPARLEAHVRMLSEKLPPRDWSHPANLDKAAEYIHDELYKAGGAVSYQPYKADGKDYRNVIASFGPDTKGRIVVGANYDAAEGTPGADDNASGVAGLIELAYILGKTPPHMRVDLVAYSLEEPPYFGTPDMGSAIHAQSLRKQEVPVRLMVSLEMLGYYSDEPGSQDYPALLLKMFYPSRGNFILVVGKFGQGEAIRDVKKAMQSASAVPVFSIRAPLVVPGIDFSDHRNYWEAGYDAVMVTDTSFYRNKQYHARKDTADALDYVRMAQVVQGVYAVIAETAGAKPSGE